MRRVTCDDVLMPLAGRPVIDPGGRAAECGGQSFVGHVDEFPAAHESHPSHQCRRRPGQSGIPHVAVKRLDLVRRGIGGDPGPNSVTRLDARLVGIVEIAVRIDEKKVAAIARAFARPPNRIGLGRSGDRHQTDKRSIRNLDQGCVSNFETLHAVDGLVRVRPGSRKCPSAGRKRHIGPRESRFPFERRPWRHRMNRLGVRGGRAGGCDHGCNDKRTNRRVNPHCISPTSEQA